MVWGTDVQGERIDWNLLVFVQLLVKQMTIAVSLVRLVKVGRVISGEADNAIIGLSNGLAYLVHDIEAIYIRAVCEKIAEVGSNLFADEGIRPIASF